MTTLQSLAVHVGTSALLGLGACLLFQCVARHPFTKPRATARPQQRRQGRSSWNWIPWTLSLTYDTMLRGVPGTGTRRNGKGGSLLRVNLDGIVLLRFHALGLRIATLATVLCLFILLPIYWSSSCHTKLDQQLSNWTAVDNDNATTARFLQDIIMSNNSFPTPMDNTNTNGPDRSIIGVEGLDNIWFPGCSWGYNRSLSNYERTTLANVPSDRSTEVISDNATTRGRLYTTVVCFWILVGYTCWLLNKEWIEMLAIRRIYYLEMNVWHQRRAELHETLKYHHPANPAVSPVPSPVRRSTRQTVRATDDFVSDDENDEEQDTAHLTHRDPWIPHPETRDTVPNVELYSLLVGSLPALPDHAADKVSVETAADWQLRLTAAFFDHCVPNQPGFSSSVAAVTLVPSARALATAWGKWYGAASALRRLNFVRKLLAERRHYEIDNATAHIRASSVPENGVTEENGFENGEQLDKMQEDLEEGREGSNSSVNVTLGLDELAINGTYDDDDFLIYTDHDGPAGRLKAYYRAVLGSTETFDDWGPEQVGVYSRELAQAAAPCCPRGPCEWWTRRYNVATLTEFEADLIDQVHEANEVWKQARDKALDAIRKRSSLQEPDLCSHTRKNYNDTVAPEIPHRQPLDGLRLPSDMHLEARVYEQANRQQKQRRTHSVGMPSNLADEDLAAKPEKSQPTEWDLVENLIFEAGRSDRSKEPNRHYISTGRWECPSVQSCVGQAIKNLQSRADKTVDNAVDLISGDSTFAVVTFTSRQAALAARTCLADGRGAERWATTEALPIPPLADAAACDLFTFRNCCRPLALGVSERQKNFRNNVTVALLGVIYLLYTVPLSLATQLVSREKLSVTVPFLNDWTEELRFDVPGLISGTITAAIWSSFFAVCPVIFKALANFGSKAPSVASAEFKALQYYWWFMVFTAFSGQILAEGTLSFLESGFILNGEFRKALTTIAATVPSTVSVVWLNWIVFRVFVTLPYQYMLQLNTFVFHYLGLKCCSRTVRGGGPGGPVPYRIFVDSGVVLMCVLALAPSSPLLAPAALLYFLYCQPLLRRNLIYVYRPKYDGGGLRWPFVFEICISCMGVATLILATQMLLKEAVEAAVLSGFTGVFVILFSREMKRKYMRSFTDAALLQTSLIDGLNSPESSSKEREEFRRFLVDAHKAAYVPVCLATHKEDEEVLTVQPAVVVPLESDVEQASIESVQSGITESSSFDGTGDLTTKSKRQRGSIIRRSIYQMSAKRRQSISTRKLSDSLRGDDFSIQSPFEGFATSRNSLSFRVGSGSSHFGGSSRRLVSGGSASPRGHSSGIPTCPIPEDDDKGK